MKLRFHVIMNIFQYTFVSLFSHECTSWESEQWKHNISNDSMAFPCLLLVHENNFKNKLFNGIIMRMTYENISYY